MKPRAQIKPCPNCGGELTYEKGFPGTYWEPPEPEFLYCEECDWGCEEDIEVYVLRPEDLF